MKLFILALLIVSGTAAVAQETSLRPVARSAANAAAATTLQPSGAIETENRDAEAITKAIASQSPGAPTSKRPETRPKSFFDLFKKRVKKNAKGSVCANPDIKGEEMGKVRSQVRGCGIEEAVRVKAVSGIALSPSAVMDCKTALTLNEWITRSAVPRLKKSGGGLSSLRVIGHYSCRTRNNQPGARISEHGKGRAIDVAGFRLRDGSSITVLNDWGSKRGFTPLREMHRDACGIFGTVLGPKSDRFHKDHFHFDTARHRGGSYCR